jgi:lipopolysaccharide export system permease protein
VRDFEFNRRDESIFRNQYRMLNTKELKMMEDTLTNDYKTRLRKYLLQLNPNRTISRKMVNLVATNDTLMRDIKVTEPDSIFSVDSVIAGFDKWIQADIAQLALESARNTMQTINMYEGQLYVQKKTLNKYKMEFHRKFTLSIAVLIFFFIGAPLGAIIRKGGLGMPVIVSILLFIFYYIISMSGEKSAREDAWSMINGMWFSSYIFLPVGVWLTYKAVTDSAIMSAETYTRFFNRLGIGKLLGIKENETEK